MDARGPRRTVKFPGLVTGFVKCRSASLLFVVLLSLVYPLPGHAVPGLVLNTPGNPPWHYPDQSGTIDRLMHEVFGRLDIRVTVQSLPAERALLNADAGIEDGDVGRVAGLTRIYPNLIQVPETLFHADFVAFTRSVTFRSDGWETLSPYDVGIINGHKAAEANIKTFQSLVSVEDLRVLFNLLAKDRVDVVVTERLFGAYIAKQSGIDDVKVMDPPLARLELYLYLHKKHSALVPRISKTLREVKSDGTYKRILDTLNGFVLR